MPDRTVEMPALSRRQALAGAAALGAAALGSAVPAARAWGAPDSAAPAGAPEGKWIDAHSHIWSTDVEHYPLAGKLTVDDLDPPSFTDVELMAVAAPEGVGRVVLIQHSIFHLFDNSYVVDAARRHPDRFRVVGMIDDRGPDPAAEMRRLLPQKVTGFRITPFIRDVEPDAWLDAPGMGRMWQTAADTRQAMCALVDVRHLAAIDRMCARHGDTPVVIDHFGRVGFDGTIRDAEVAQLCRLARHKQVAVKISAFYALGEKKPPHTELVPMIRRLLDAYGVERLMWASDSPYQLQKGNDYASSIALVRDRLDFLSAGDRQALLAATAERVFRFR